jgi:hypothetical protein
MPPIPKLPSQRQRTNRHVTAATLAERPTVQRVELAELDPRPHRPETIRFWNAIWSSPSRAEWDESDVAGGLLSVAALMDVFYDPTRTGKRGRDTRVTREISAHLRELGLTPRARAGLMRSARLLPPIRARQSSPEPEP